MQTQEFKTARIKNCDCMVVKIVKQSKKTSIVELLSNGSSQRCRVNNDELTEDVSIPLNKETAKTARAVISVQNPQWGLQDFRNSGITECGFDKWRVITTYKK